MIQRISNYTRETLQILRFIGSFSILTIRVEIQVKFPLLFSLYYLKFLYQTLVDQIVSIKNVEFCSANQGALILK